MQDWLLRPLRPVLGRLQVRDNAWSIQVQPNPLNFISNPTLIQQLRAFSAAGWLSSLLPAATVPFTNQWLVAPALHAFAWGGETGVSVPEGYKGICLDDHPVHFGGVGFGLAFVGFEPMYDSPTFPPTHKQQPHTNNQRTHITGPVPRG